MGSGGLYTQLVQRALLLLGVLTLVAGTGPGGLGTAAAADTNVVPKTASAETAPVCPAMVRTSMPSATFHCLIELPATPEERHDLLIQKRRMAYSQLCDIVYEKKGFNSDAVPLRETVVKFELLDEQADSLLAEYSL